MAARDDDLGAAYSIFHRHDIGAQAVANIVIFHDHAFPLRHDGFKLAQIENHIGTIEPAHRAAHDLTGPVLELLVNHFFLDLANPLHHRLLRRLRGDAAKILRRHFHFHCVTDFRLRLDSSRLGERDIVLRILNVVHHEQIGERADLAGLRVDVDAQVARGADAFLRSRAGSRV